MKLLRYDDRIYVNAIVKFGNGAFWRIVEIVENSPSGVNIVARQILDDEGQIASPYLMRFDYSPSYLLDDDYAKELIQKNVDMLEKFKNNLTQLGFTL